MKEHSNSRKRGALLCLHLVVQRMARLSLRTTLLIVLALLAGVVLAYQVLASRANAGEDLTKTLLYKITRSQGPCPSPDYTLQGAIEPHRICLTTLTDEATGGWWQRHFRWRNFDNLLDITWENKRLYVEKHGYRLFNESKRSLDTSRPPSWSKTRAVKRLLQEEGCEWVFWMDADTVIMNSSVKMESFLPVTYDLLMTEEKGNSWNAGAWVMRNSAWSIDFLDTWWNMTSFVKPKGLSVSGDNDALKFYLTKHHDELFGTKIFQVPRCTFNSVASFLPKRRQDKMTETEIKSFFGTNSHRHYHKGDFVAHVAGVNNKVKGVLEVLKDAE